MKVTIRLDKTSQGIELEAKNAYQKGDMYCVYLISGKVKKYPMCNIFEVEEDYENTTSNR